MTPSSLTYATLTYSVQWLDILSEEINGLRIFGVVEFTTIIEQSQLWPGRRLTDQRDHQPGIKLVINIMWVSLWQHPITKRPSPTPPRNQRNKTGLLRRVVENARSKTMFLFERHGNFAFRSEASVTSLSLRLWWRISHDAVLLCHGFSPQPYMIRLGLARLGTAYIFGLHNMYSLFIAIIPCISKYKAFNIISFFDIIIIIRFEIWSPLNRNKSYLRILILRKILWCWSLMNEGTKITL